MQRFGFGRIPTFIRQALPKPIDTLKPALIGSFRMFPGDELGRGESKGGGKGGSIRDAGGAMGKREAGLEEEYFHRKNKEHLEAMKKHLKTEMKFHEQQIELHKAALERQKKSLDKLHDD
uniref:ATPase inhibitor mai-2 n=1 Tax=Schistocephalus solidus TaxID=70667 RepID=A0A0V0JC31_SCHSO